MAFEKFITIDLQTGKKILKELEASLINYDGSKSVKEAILDVIKSVGGVDTKVTDEIARAKDAEAALQGLIDSIEDAASKLTARVATVEGLVSGLRADVDANKTAIDANKVTMDNHIANTDVHVTTANKAAWNKVVTDLASEVSNRIAADDALTTSVNAKAATTYVNTELAKKVAINDLLSGDKIKESYLPSIAINTTQVVDSVDAAMALQIENGDVVIINPTEGEVSGTFICIDATEPEFEARFRELYSSADAISKAAVEALIKTESDARKAADSTLTTAVNKEVSDREGAVKTVSDAVNKEITDRTNAVQGVSDAVDAEVTARTAAVKTVSDAVTTEKNRAVAAEGALSGRLDVVEGEGEGSVKKALADAKAYADAEVAKEVTNRNDAITPVKNKADANAIAIAAINNTETGILALAKADATSKVNTEITNREQADTALSNRIAKLEAANTEAVVVAYDAGEAKVGDAVKIVDGIAVKASQADEMVAGLVVELNAGKAMVAITGRLSVEGLEANKVYFLGDNGALTATAPSAVGKHIIVVGRTVGETDFLLRIEEAIEIK